MTESEKNTQNKIAEQLNLSPSFFSQLLSGTRNIGNLNEAKRISEILKNDNPTIWIQGGGTSAERKEACGLS